MSAVRLLKEQIQPVLLKEKIVSYHKVYSILYFGWS